jgi:hypothetical protein
LQKMQKEGVGGQIRRAAGGEVRGDKSMVDLHEQFFPTRIGNPALTLKIGGAGAGRAHSFAASPMQQIGVDHLRE